MTAPDRVAQRRCQLADLVRGTAVAPKQDETNRVSGAEKAAFVRAQLFAGAAQDDRARRLSRRSRRLIGQ